MYRYDADFIWVICLNCEEEYNTEDILTETGVVSCPFCYSHEYIESTEEYCAHKHMCLDDYYNEDWY